MSNALVDVRFTLDVPEEKVLEICKAAGIEGVESDDGWRAMCEAVEQWAEEAWPHRLDWITSTPDVGCER